MRKKNTLYTANKWNQPLFARGVDRVNNNIFDNGGSTLTVPSQPSTLSQDLQSSLLKVEDPGKIPMKSATEIANMYNKPKMGNAARTALGVGSGIIGNLAYKGISGGLSSGAGSAISSLGGTAGSIVGMANPVLGAAITAASGIVGGLTNAAFGSKLNEENIAAVNNTVSGMRDAAHAMGKSRTSTDILNQWGSIDMGSDFDNSYIGKDGWFSSKAKKEAERLRNKQNIARMVASHALATTADNVDAATDDIAAQNVKYAFGGFLGDTSDMGAIDYGFMSDYLSMKDKQADKSKITGMTQMPAFMNGFALGGDLQTHGADWTNGATHIDAGGSHEENKYQGVQLGTDQEGTPNLVEEGEVVFNDYVYSKRILADEDTKKQFRLPRKKDISYADIAKRLTKESAERPNDPISQAALQMQMNKLAEQQERQKAEMQEAQAQEAFASLSPEEKQALLMEAAARRQQGAEEQQMAEQAMQEQAMAEQEMQEPSPEELAMAQQQMMANGSELSLGSEPEGYAYGGKVNKFENGGDENESSYQKLLNIPKEELDRLPLDIAFAKQIEAALAENDTFVDSPFKDALYKALNIKNNEGLYDWLVKHNYKRSQALTMIPDILLGAGMAIQNDVPGFIPEAFRGDPVLSHAISAGYNFVPQRNWDLSSERDEYDWNSFWKKTNEYSKKGGHSSEKYQIDPTYSGNIKELEASPDYRAFTEYITKKAPNDVRDKYLGWIDENTGNSDNKYITPSGLRKDWIEQLEKARNDGFMGIQHETPQKLKGRGAKVGNFLVGADGTITTIDGEVSKELQKQNSYSWQDKDSDWTYNYYRDPKASKAKDAEGKKSKIDLSQYEPVLKKEWPRYAGLFGPAVGLGMQALGIGKPNTAGLDAAVNLVGRSGARASYQPIPDFLRVQPMDMWSEQNKMDANSRATDRSILNSGNVQGSRMAGLLANNYNSMLASGDLYKKGLEYNDANRKMVTDFNRGTNTFNADAYNKVSLANAEMANRKDQAQATLAMQAAQAKMNADAAWNQGIYGNVSGLFKGVGELGRENAQHNMLAKMAASGLFGYAEPENAVFSGLIKRKNSAKKGGKIIKRKRKGGLTI